MRRENPNVGASKKLDMRARLALFEGTSAVIAEVLRVDDSELNRDMFLATGVKPVNVLAAKLGPMDLKRRGFKEISTMRSFGFDALHLTDPWFSNQLIIAFGRDATLNTFLATASDAVAIAGSEAQEMLNISTTTLLACCSGFPLQAAAVLEQLPNGVSLEGVAPLTLLDAGLRATALKACGYGLVTIVAQTGASAHDLSKLGFSM